MLRNKPSVLGTAPNGTTGPSSSTVQEIKPHPRAGPSRYPHRLSFYTYPPTEEVTTDEFEQFAIDRLRVLAEIESAFARNRSPDELKQILGNRLKTCVPLSANSARTVDVEAERKKDAVGHFVLRLAVCRSEELRSRFVRAEAALFRYRWETDDQAERETFLNSLNFDWSKVSLEEKAEFRNELINGSSHLRDLATKFDSESFFKVHWTRVTDLVNSRRVFVRHGQAYVPTREQLSLVIAEFSARLEKALEVTARALPRLDEDDRLLPVLDHLSLSFLAGVASEYASGEGFGEGSEGAVTADMVDDLARRHFPLCMKHLHQTLREKKHLKHGGRLQYNLFLKGIGMPVEEALVFWRKAFSNITDDKFAKEYKYNFRHGYGLEGGRKNYPPMNCQRILTGNAPGTQDAHGCPFRHFSSNALSSALASNYPNLTAPEIKDMTETSKAGHYHLACTRLYEITHHIKKGDGLLGESVTHPNLYFDRSRQLERGQEATAPKMEVDVKP